MEERLRGASERVGPWLWRASRWLNRARWEGHDNYGAYGLTAGSAIAVSFLLFALLPRVSWLTWLVFWILLGVGVWYGNQLEYRQLRALGRRRARGTLLLGITWLTYGLVGTLALVLLGLARLRGWHHLEGWQDMPILVTAVTALNHLAHGVRLGIRRRLLLGAAMCGVIVLLPGVRVLRENLYLATSVLTGGLEVAGGLLGRRVYQEALGRVQGPTGELVGELGSPADLPRRG